MSSSYNVSRLLCVFISEDNAFGFTRDSRGEKISVWTKLLKLVPTMLQKALRDLIQKRLVGRPLLKVVNNKLTS